MPGIYGYLARGDRAQLEESPAAKLERMLAAAPTPHDCDVSRYGDDWFAVASIGFGGRARSSGEISEHGSNRICLDGFLLNREEVVGELRRHSRMDGSEATDETLVSLLYEHVGDEVTKHLTGTFNICAYSEQFRSIQLISCRHGAFHLFYALTDRFLAFATQMRALIAVGDISNRIDELALSDMFNFGYIGGTRTLFQDVKLLDSATVFTVGQQSIAERTHWTYEFENVGSAPHRQNLEEETAAALREAGTALRGSCRSYRSPLEWGARFEDDTGMHSAKRASDRGFPLLVVRAGGADCQEALRDQRGELEAL